MSSIAPQHLLGAHMERELRSQPALWLRAAELATTVSTLPRPGERVAIVGCGTSWFVGQVFAALREGLGFGETDAFAASESPLAHRDYDAVILLSRSGTTSEVLKLAAELRGRTRLLGIVGDEASPLPAAVDSVIALPFADEQSVVQTRFATSTLALLRAHLGHDLEAVAAQAREALDTALGEHLITAEQLTFLGSGWSVGIAHEAALKLRESAQAWTESYPAMEYRHGPIAIAAPGRAVWVFGDAPEGLSAEVARTGAHVEDSALDPLADLVRAHQLSLARARALGVDPDAPRNLSRSVILNE